MSTSTSYIILQSISVITLLLITLSLKTERREVSGKLGPEQVPNRPHCLLNQRSCPYEEKCFQNIEIAEEYLDEPR